jgi:hypothetical protein
VDSFVKHQADHYFETTSISQENPRFEVLGVVLEAKIEGFREYGYNSYAELVFNLDKVGIRELGDRAERKVIIPSTMIWRTIVHGTHRNLKHILVMTCI